VYPQYNSKIYTLRYPVALSSFDIKTQNTLTLTGIIGDDDRVGNVRYLPGVTELEILLSKKMKLQRNKIL